MTVTIEWRSSDGGSEITDPLDHGQAGSGNSTTIQDIYLYHDGNNPITNCRFWIYEYSGTYTGGNTASGDIGELLSWGSATDEDEFGGFQVNMDAINSFPTWPTYNNKYDSTNGKYSTFYSGRGDSAANGVILSSAMSTGMTINGVIPASVSPNPHFKCRIKIPTNETTLGIREFDQRLSFTFTS